MTKPSCGIYKITCTQTGHFYIGASRNIEMRWKNHRRDLDSVRREEKEGKLFQREWEKYGNSSFRFEIIELVDNPHNLFSVEDKYLYTLRPAFNHIPKTLISKMERHLHFTLTVPVYEKLARVSKRRRTSVDKLVSRYIDLGLEGEL